MNFVQTVEADAEKVIGEVEAGLTWLKAEGSSLIKWVDSSIPGAQTAVAQFVAGAEADAATLAQLGAQGLNDAIAGAAPQIETVLANLIQSSGLVKVNGGTAAVSVLDQLDAAGVSTLATIGKALVTTALTTILGKLAPQPTQ